MVGPARAGMIRNATAPGMPRLGWPRTSGDDPLTEYKHENIESLAPHERG